jgi:DNA excision repair protein ERCC-2
MKETIPIPLRDFAMPTPRSGSLDAPSGYGRQAAEGQEIHQRVQKRRAKADPDYRAEVALTCQFEHQGFRFRIDGRMDGIFLHDRPRIEEIKSAFDLAGLIRHLEGNPFEHPYSLQLLSYGYFHWREHGVIPDLSLHLVSSRTGRSRDLELPLDLGAYEQWLALRLDELAREARQAEKRAQRRRKVAAAFSFPFSAPRPGQVELMEEIGQGMALGRPMLIQAPTGLGKTVGVLYPVLREALARGQRVVYVTPKNSQHGVAEDAVDRLREAGARLTSLTVTAKGKICFQDEPLCSPEACEYARDYYTKLHHSNLPEILGRKRSLKARLFRELGREYRVCPFELQFEAAPAADVLICDYNYVFAPRSALGRSASLEVGQTGKPSLVIDEAHNLPARAMEYYSPLLSSAVLEGLREEIRGIAPRFRAGAEKLLDGCLETVATCRPSGASRPARIDPPLNLFLEQDARLRAFLSGYLESDTELGPRDPLLRLCFAWSEFCALLEQAVDPERDEFFVTFHPGSAGGTLKITCCDASAMLKGSYDGYQQVVAFSATLKPFEYYARLSGLSIENIRTSEFGSPFPREHRKLLIIPQVSTRYDQRSRNYARIADAVQRIAALRQGNYFVFLPSFEFLEQVAALFQPPAGFAVIRQERGMRGVQLEAVLERLRSCSEPVIVFAVQGGSFSEGVDYAGEMVIGAFVIGPPLPNYDLEREQMRACYQRRYGAGFAYAYTIPAMAKAVQAAGRVIRSERERGLIVLMDRRFTEPDYTSAMPADWFETEVTELVSDSILADVAAFWSKPG